MILPFAYELYSSGTRTSHGWSVFWNDLPLYLLRWFGVFLVVATLMHLVFARIALQLNRFIFLLFPILSLLCASLAFWIVWFGVVERVSWDELIYPLLGVLAVVFFHMIWITYPLALANQWLLKEILDNPIRPQAELVRRDGILNRLIVFIRRKI